MYCFFVGKNSIEVVCVLRKIKNSNDIFGKKNENKFDLKGARDRSCTENR